MKGKILGYADANGVISGDDGKRYKFAAADWKSQRAPKIGEEVDYEISTQGGAAEIYPTHASAGFDLGDVGHKVKEALGPGGAVDLENVGAKAKAVIAVGSSSPAGARALTLLTTRLSVPLALVLLVASLFFDYVSWNGAQLDALGSSSSGGYSILGIASLSSNVGGLFSKIGQQAGAQLAGAQQALDVSVRAGAPDDATKTMRDAVSAMQGASSGSEEISLCLDLMYLLYLVPLGAIFILFLEWRDDPIPLASLVVGGLSMFGFLLAFVTEWIVNGTIKDVLAGLLAQMGAAGGIVIGMSVGFGAWLLLLCGAGLVLNALGMVRIGPKTA